MILSQLSGGYDSVAVLIRLLYQGHEVQPIFIQYGQLYGLKELKAVQYVCDYLACEELKNLKIIHTKMELQLKIGDTVSDYIPIRNLVLAALTANYAISRGIKKIAVGSKTVEVRADDPWSFSDCSVKFFNMFAYLVKFASEDKAGFEVLMPLIENGSALTKAQTIKIILNSGMDLNKLWSCYTDLPEPCGKCYHCKENIKAMEELDV